MLCRASTMEEGGGMLEVLKAGGSNYRPGPVPYVFGLRV